MMKVCGLLVVLMSCSLFARTSHNNVKLSELGSVQIPYIEQQLSKIKSEKVRDTFKSERELSEYRNEEFFKKSAIARQASATVATPRGRAEFKLER